MKYVILKLNFENICNTDWRSQHLSTCVHFMARFDDRPLVFTDTGQRKHKNITAIEYQT
jgi:hypothetical protein